MNKAMGSGVRFTDLHTHVLPMMDDGSQSAEQSVEMLRLLKRQGIDRVVATPHFYPKQEDPDSFLKRRADSAAMLRSAIEFAGLEGELPEVLIGAEVAYYSGMSLSKRVKELCIEGTDVMLLEMPFSKWTDAVVNEVCKMQMELGVQIILAHVDRYFQYFDNAKLYKLKSYRVMMQINADPFLEFWSGRRVLKLLGTNMIGALGSDCHNLDVRRSNMDEAIARIREKGYGQKLAGVMRGVDSLLSGAVALVDTTSK